MALDIESIEARANAATPGPWESRGLAYSTCVGKVGDYRNLARLGDPLDQPAWRNAEFIAAAREDVPALVAEVRRLLKVAEAAEGVMRHLEEYGPAIVPHLMDTDDNDGEELRQALREWREASE